MTRLTSKGIYKGGKSSTHKYATKIRNREKRRVQMQNTGDALAVKDQQLKTISYIYV